MRPVALGRKNWIHVGSQQAGPKVAAILSIVESCRRLKIPIRKSWLPFCPASLTSRFGGSQNSRPQLGRPRAVSPNRCPVNPVFPLTHTFEIGRGIRSTNDLFQMLAGRGGIRGDIELPYLIDVYRRYARWARPLLVPLSNAVCLIEGKSLPDPKTGMSKRAEIIRHRRSQMSSIASIHAFAMPPPTTRSLYDHDRGIVNFTDVDGDGNSLGSLARHT